MKKYIILILVSLSVQTFAQWKSYYPEGTTQKKNTNKSLPETAKDKLNFDAHFYTALHYKSLERYDDAEKEFKKCIELDAKNAVPYYELALIHQSSGRYQTALELSKQAHQLVEKNIWYKLTYAELLTHNGFNTKAIAIYKQLIKEFPGNEEYYFLLAENYLLTDNYSEAIEIFGQLEQYMKGEPSIIIQKQKLYLKMGNFQGAIAEAEKLVALDENNITSYEMLAELYLLSNQQDKAMDIFKKILELDPSDAKIHLTLADYYRAKGDNETSYQELKLAFISPKLSIETKLEILISYYPLLEDSAMNKQAMELCELFVKTHSDNPVAYAIYGDFLYKTQSKKEAIQKYKEALAIEKNRLEVWLQLLYVESELEDYSTLVEDSREAIELFPINPVFYYLNAVANTQTKHFADATNALKMGLDFVIENDLLVDFYALLGDNYNQMHQYSSSDSAYDLALALQPDNLYILNNYSYYLSLRKEKLDKAIKMSARCNELSPENDSFLDTYAWILYQQGQFEDAKKWIEKALANGGDKSPTIVDHFGDILYKLGDKKRALEMWKKANELGGHSELLQQKIADKKLYE